MKFKNLTEEHLKTINEEYRKNNRAAISYFIMGYIGTSLRTAERIAKKMGLTRKYDNSKRAVNITVIDPIVVRAEKKSPAKVLLYDIETSPLKSYVWGLWEQNIGHNMAMLQNDWFILTWSAKWLFEDEVFSDRLTPEEVFAEDDKRIVQSLWEMIEEADVVIAHNGKKFDNKRINTRFLKHGIKQPMPYQTIDTLLTARANFNISSNKLDYIGQFLGVGRKVETQGFELWKRCMQGEEQALKDMETYNIGDVTLLEDVYLKLRPYVKPHPNMGLFISEDVECCPSCGSEDLERGGTYATTVSIYEAMRCNNCGSVGRSRKSIIPVGSNKNLTVPSGR